jgi:hypothetical protein
VSAVAEREPRFYLKTGELTVYALSCGYVDLAERSGIGRVRLFMEHSTFHVQAYDDRARLRTCWDVHETIGPARARFRELAKHLRNAPTSSRR